MPKITELLKVSTLTFILIAILWCNSSKLTPTSKTFLNHWDHHKYIHMAQTPLFDLRIAPFCWRILNPELVKLMPFSIETNFKALTFIFLWVASVLLFYVLKKFGFTSTLAIIGAAFFISSNWVSRFNIFDFWLTDPLSFAFTNLIILLILHNKLKYLALTLMLGVFAKESIIFTAPLIYTLKANRFFDKDLLVKTVIVSLPAIVIIFLIRSNIPSLNGIPEYLNTIPANLRDPHTYQIGYLFNQIGLNRINNFRFYDFYQMTVGTFSLTLISLILFAIRENLIIFLKFSPFIFLRYSSLLFAVNTERLIISSVPAIIIMSLNGAQKIINRYQINPWLFLIPSITTVIYLSLNPTIWNIKFEFQAIILLSLFVPCMLQGYFNSSTRLSAH